MAARSRRCSPSRSSSGWPGCSSSSTASGRSASPAASPPCGPTCRCWSAKLAALPVDLALTTNGATLRSVAAGPGRRRAPARERVARLAAARALRRAHPARPARRRARRHRRRHRGRAHAGEGERRRGARRQRRRDRRPGRATGASAASPCASSSGCRSTAATPGRNDQVVTQAEIVERIAAVFPLEPVQRGSEPAERFRYLDGARRGRA